MLFVASVGLLGCGAQPLNGTGATDPDTIAISPTAGLTSVPAAVETSVPSTELYTAITTVIDGPGDDPRLCLGGQLDSAPPICGDVPVHGLDWDAVTGERQIGDVTWIERAVVVGTYDGSALALTEQPRLATDAEIATAVDVHNGPVPCAEPTGGWAADGARFPSGSEYNAFIERVDDYTSTRDDWGGAWIDYIDGDSTIDLSNRPDKVILVEMFTSDIAGHDADLRAIWPGAMCVTLSARTSADLEALADEVTQDEQGAGSLDLVLRSSANVDYARGAVRVFVPIATSSIQAAFDRKYGAGAVVVSGVLKPVPGP